MAVAEGLGRAESVERFAPAVASEGATEAARELYERHGLPILRFCRSRLRTREEAEDARQTVFLQAFRALRAGVVPISELSWLLKIAENVCKSARRDARQRLEIAADPETLDLVPAANPELELLMPLQEALGRLTEPQRQALLLREWKGLSYRELADELGTTQGAVEVLLFRARRALAQELESPATARRRVRGLDLAWLAGLVRQLLGGGTTLAGKSALAAIAVAAAVIPTVAISTATDGPSTPRAQRAQSRVEVPAPPPTAVEQRADPRRSPKLSTAPRRDQSPAAVHTPTQSPPRSEPEREVAPASSAEPVLDQREPSPLPVPHPPPTEVVSSTLAPVVDTSAGTVASVTETVDEAVQTVVDTAGETVATVSAVVETLPAPTLPALPTLP